MLATQLRHIYFLDSEIVRLEEEIKVRILLFEKVLERLDTILGEGSRTDDKT
jgi:hypothetical protein